MRTIHSEKHQLRNARSELVGGRLLPPFEKPERVAHILARIAETKLGPVEAPNAYGLGPALRVHDEKFVEFLSTVWDRWVAQGHEGEVIPTCWPSRRMPWQGVPDAIDGAVGWYALAGETAISAGTWEAAQAAADVAVTGADLVAGGEPAVFSLCRPPGHHAAQDMYGGYCFLNNAAIAAQRFLDGGAKRVAILDVDYHHGNGTQAIFYDRSDVLFLSLHADPMVEFPFFLGHAAETGAGPGEGFNVNYAMPHGTGYDVWSAALEDALKRIRAYAPDVLIVSLGVDTFKLDPISRFRLESADFTDYGRRIAGLKLPTLFVMEGGYAVAEIGINTVNVLTGFEGA